MSSRKAEYMRVWREANQEKIRDYNRKYRAAREDVIRDKEREYRLKNSERIAARKAAWRDKFPDEATATDGYSNHRRLGGRFPAGMTRKQIVEGTVHIYAEARRMTQETGVQHDVHHIVARSDGGLHCAENLQVLSAIEHLVDTGVWLTDRARVKVPTPTSTAVRSKRWQSKNRDRVTASAALCRARKKGATIPSGLVAAEIISLTLPIYAKCRAMRRETGIAYEVDHIIPIAYGGRHHPDNLQIITRCQNRAKIREDKAIWDLM